MKRSTVIAAVAVAVVVLGALLPWAEVHAGLLSVSKAGTDSDGILTLLIGVAIGITLLVAHNGRLLWLPLLGAAALVVLIGLVDMADVASKSATVGRLTISADIGVGLWLTVLGGIGLGVAGVVQIREAQLATS